VRRSTRTLVLIAILVLAALGAWWFLTSRRVTVVPQTIAIYYTKLDGSTEGAWQVTMHPPQPGESPTAYLTETAQYAAVQAVAGPPPSVEAIRFPAGTRVNGVRLDGSVAIVDLGGAIERPQAGSFAENGEFKALVYTLTALPGIDAVQVEIDGHRVETLPGGHLALDVPLRRSDW